MTPPKSKKQLQRESNLYIGVGFLVYIAAVFSIGLLSDSAPLMILVILIAIASLVAYVYGCTRFMLSKGYSPWLGLLGLLGLVGLIVLAVMPDKWIENAAPPPSPTNYPRHPQA